MSEYPVNYPLVVHTAWREGEATDAPTKLIFVVNARRRKLFIAAILSAALFMGLSYVDLRFSFGTSIIMATLVVTVAMHGKRGRAGYYSVKADGTLSERIRPGQIDRSGLTRRRLRWWSVRG